MWRSQNLEPAGTAGFTLLEALAALGVMAAGLSAIGALANSNLRVSLHSERHLAEIETARKIIAGMPGRNELPFGRLTGVLDAHQWRIESAALPTTLATPGAAWVPQSVTLLVRSPSGATIEIDTIRLRAQATK